jgi:hypothetical protein
MKRTTILRRTEQQTVRHPAGMKVILVAEGGPAADRRGCAPQMNPEIPSGPSTSALSAGSMSQPVTCSISRRTRKYPLFE